MKKLNKKKLHSMKIKQKKKIAYWRKGFKCNIFRKE